MPTEAAPLHSMTPAAGTASQDAMPAGGGDEAVAAGGTQSAEPVAATIGPPGPPAVTERPTGAERTPPRRAAALPSLAGPALLLWRQARAGFSRLLRLAAVAVSMGIVAVFAYHGGEHLAGLVGIMSSAAAPGHPAPAALPDRDRSPAAASMPVPAAAPLGGTAGKPPEGLGEPAAYYLDRAKVGDPAAQFNLAALYARGDGVAQDFASAAAWFAEAAAAGNVTAQFNLAVMYERGLGVGQNQAEAIAWYRRAAEHDYVPAQYNLALACAEGRGLPQDMVAAAHWYHQAAARGSIPAMVNLAILYETGDGVERSPPEAYAWYRAAARGRDDVAERRARELFQQFVGAEKGKAVLAAALVVDMINQPLARHHAANPPPSREPAAVRPVASETAVPPAAAPSKPTEPGGPETTLKPGGWTKRGAAEPKPVRTRPAG